MGSEWRKVKLEEVASEITVGYVGSMTSEYIDSGVPFLRSKNVDPFTINLDDIKYISSEFNEKLKKSALAPGDVVIVRTGKPGTCAVIPEWLENANCSDLVIVRCGPEINNRFLAYYVNTVASSHVNAHLVGAVQQHFNVGSAKLMELSLPPLEMQDKIVSILAALDNKIALNRQINTTLESMAQALFKSWFVDFDPVIDNALAAGNEIPDALQKRAAARAVRRKALRQQTNQTANETIGATDADSPEQALPDTGLSDQRLPPEIQQLFPDRFVLTEEMGWVPEGWGIESLDRIANYQNGLALQKFRPEDESNFLPVVKIAQLKKGYADGEEKASPNIKPECIIDDGDVVFSWSGSLMVDVWCGGRAALNQHLFKVTSDEYPKWFFLHFTLHHLTEFQRIAADKAVTMGHIKREHLSQAKCSVPGMDFMEKLSPFFDPLLNKAVLSRLENRALIDLRDSLLPKLLSGQITIPDAEQQLAEVL